MNTTSKTLILALGLTITLFAASWPLAWVLFTVSILLICHWKWDLRQINWPLALVAVLTLTALLADLIAPFHPDRQLEPGFHPFGLDRMGRDLFTRLLYGNRNSIAIALAGSLFACLIGFLMSGVLSYSPRYIRLAFKNLIQAWLSIPLLLFFMLGLSLFSQGVTTMVMLMAFTLWPEPARLVQVRVQELEHSEFAQSARMLGKSELRIFFSEILPNLVPILTITFLLTLTNAMLLEAVLGYLGIGLETGSASLGRLIQEGSQSLERQPHILIIATLLLLAWFAGLKTLLRRLSRTDAVLVAQSPDVEGKLSI